MLENFQIFFSSATGIMAITITVTMVVTALVTYLLNKMAFVKYKKDKKVQVESATEIGYRYHVISLIQDKTKHILLVHPGGIMKLGEEKILTPTPPTTNKQPQ